MPAGNPGWASHGGEVGQKVVHWIREWQALQYSCLENPMNSMKRQYDRIPKEELPGSLGSQYATGDQRRNNHTIVLISHASKVMLKILQVRLQRYVNHELPAVQAGFRKGRGTRDQIANIHWIMEKAREYQKNICFIDYAKAFDCVDHIKLWEILKEMGIPNHLTCLLKNLYAGQEATVRTGHGIADWF